MVETWLTAAVTAGRSLRGCPVVPLVGARRRDRDDELLVGRARHIAADASQAIIGT
jgi:hypothetical protein